MTGSGPSKQDKPDREQEQDKVKQAPVIRIPLRGGGEFDIAADFLKELDEIYVDVDPLQTLREIRGWCLGNPERCKTKSGVKRFIVRWFAQEQERYGRKK